MNHWVPQSIVALRHYNRHTFVSDAIAGVTVGLVALPLAMAFAIASGMSPQAGIYCAIVAGFLTAALGGSMTAIGGPTGAFVVVVAGIIGQYGINGLFLCTMMAGIILIALGASGVGSAVKYIPRPVVVGFTNGIAVLIASTQLRDFFGLRIAEMPDDFIERMRVVASHFSTISWPATALGIATVATVIVTPRVFRRVPGTIVAMLGVSIAAVLMALPVETIGTRFGGVPSGLPRIQFPAIQWAVLPDLLVPAMTVAMLGAIESLLSATVADRMMGTRHNPNVELMAQGVANFFSPLVGGLPATGAIARTATNIRSGGKTPVAGMIHAITLLLILLFAAPLAAQVPLAVLAGLLFIVAYNMGEWHEIPSLLKMTKADIAVWLATFALTVVADLTVAVEVGMVLAALLFIRRVAETTSVKRVTGELIEEGSAPLAAGGGDSRLCGGVSHPRSVSLRCDRQADGHPGSTADAAADRHRAASPRAGDGCIGAPGASRILPIRFTPRGATLLLVRGARAAGASHGARRVPRAPRGREHPAERAGGADARARHRGGAGS